MAYILIHTSSLKMAVQNQALRLQQELQIIGHTVEYSQSTHPFRLLKNNYDVFHLLSDTSHLSLIDTPLILLAKLNRIATVVSHYDSFNITRTQLIHKIQSHSIDAFSTTNIESLKANKLINKNKFILPLFPTEIKLNTQNKSKNISQLKILSNNFNELLTAHWPSFVDASALTSGQSASTIRKHWKKFQAQNPLFKKCILILSKDNTLELMQTQSLIVDVSSLTDSIYFQSLIDGACAFEQFIILSQNQASGYSEFWIHLKNCWINDLEPQTNGALNDMTRAAIDFFKKTKNKSMDISTDYKMNELSRIYAKIMHEKALTYNHDKVRPA